MGFDLDLQVLCWRRGFFDRHSLSVKYTFALVYSDPKLLVNAIA